MVHVAYQDVEAYAKWAGKRLPIHLWMTPIMWTQYTQIVKVDERDIVVGNISIAELSLAIVTNSGSLSSRHQILAQSALSLAVTVSQILRTTIQAISGIWLSARSLSQPLNKSLSVTGKWSYLLLSERSLKRNFDHYLTRYLARYLSPLLAGRLVQYLCQAISSPRLNYAILPTRKSDYSILSESANTEWLAFQPDGESEQLEAIERIQGFLRTKDDWTRLLAINNLITLSSGTPELVAERNRLCDLAMKTPDEFTFPAELVEATKDKEWFNLPEIIAIIFLHEAGDPFLKPEWFDPKSEESKFFLSPPREFFALAAEVLDPEGKTELAKWRKS